jgi:DNA polymerase III epsilon subunit-like protein
MKFKTLNLVSIDLETGGLNPKENSLLEIGMASFIDNKRGPELFLKIKYDKYNVTEGARKVNGFDAIEHEKTAINPKEALIKIKSYFKELMILNNGKKIMAAGRNVNFDISFLRQFFKSYSDEGLDDYLFFYHLFDLTPIGYFLYQVNMIDILPSSNDKMCDALGIPEEVKPHSALNGARINLDVYERILQLFNETFERK